MSEALVAQAFELFKDAIVRSSFVVLLDQRDGVVGELIQVLPHHAVGLR